MDNELRAMLVELSDNSEWRGYVKGKLEGIFVAVEDMKTSIIKNDERVCVKVSALEDIISGLRVRVAGWSALFGSIGAAIMYFVVRAIAQ